MPRKNHFYPEQMREPTALELAWAAGIIEGEGCIRLQVIDIRDWRRGTVSKDRVTMSVSVSMKDAPVIARLNEFFGGHCHCRPDGLMALTMSSRRALWCLERVEPFMVGEKKPQARLAIEFQRGRLSGTRPPGRHAWELDAARRISEMKKVGIYERRKGPKATRLEAALARQAKPEVSSIASGSGRSPRQQIARLLQRLGPSQQLPTL